MKIKIYIVTWQDANALHNNLSTLFAGFQFAQDVDIHVNIINNHTNFKCNS
jgi:hypothetical protein